mmetsp:Transcript_42732/g.132385  ORF Transcript_42732/g.132385 Transcript_42732/m.132385 type:complete len:245 (+) Transcript_42732:1-735(+)
MSRSSIVVRGTVPGPGPELGSCSPQRALSARSRPAGVAPVEARLIHPRGPDDWQQVGEVEGRGSASQLCRAAPALLTALLDVDSARRTEIVAKSRPRWARALAVARRIAARPRSIGGSLLARIVTATAARTVALRTPIAARLAARFDRASSLRRRRTVRAQSVAARGRPLHAAAAAPGVLRARCSCPHPQVPHATLDGPHRSHGEGAGGQEPKVAVCRHCGVSARRRRTRSRSGDILHWSRWWK